MPKRRRLYTPMKNKVKNIYNRDSSDVKEATTARGRLKGALMDVLDPGFTGDDSDSSLDQSAYKGDSQYQSSDEEEKIKRSRRKSPPRQSYVLKLFDRSVDLSQFNENSPLYPICRAWIANQPKAIYSEIGKAAAVDPEMHEDSVDLPGPEGPIISKIPPLTPEQLKADKNNINLNYREAPPPGKDQLLSGHVARWAQVRQAWLDQSAHGEARYAATQQLLNKINVNAM